MQITFIKQFTKKYLYKECSLIILALLIMLPFYFYKLSTLPTSVHGDETETAFQALQIIQGGAGLIGVGWFDLPLLSFLPHAFFMLLFGQTIIADRLGSIIFGILVLPILYLLLKDFFDKRVAFVSTILLGTSHMWLALSRIGITYVQSTFFIASIVYILLKAFKTHKTIYFILGGAMFGLSLYSNFAVRIVPILTLVLFIHYFVTTKLTRKKILNITCFLVLAVIIFTPQGSFYLKNPGTFSSRENSVFVFSKMAKEWTNYTNMSNAQIILTQTTRAFNIFAGDNSTQYGFKGQLLDYLSIFFFLVGVSYGALKVKYFRYQFMFFWLLLAILGQIFTSIPPPIFLPRFVVGLPIIYLFISIGILKGSEIISKLLIKHKYLHIIAILFIACIVFWNIYTYFVIYPKQIDGDPNARSATKIGYYLNTLNKNYTAYFDTMPTIWAGYRLIQFISPTGHKTDITDSDLNNMARTPNRINQIKEMSKVNDIAFVIYPEYNNSLKTLSNIFPNGQIITFKEIDNSVQFYIFKLRTQN